MALPVPRPGLVISYSFLWPDEDAAGRESGAKDRPCAIVLATQQDDGDLTVLVVPITHAPPRDPSLAVELPAATKQRLGLDSGRSWVIVTELNRFIWPGPDLRPVAPGRFEYGLLPAALFEEIRQKILTAYDARRTRIVKRTE